MSVQAVKSFDYHHLNIRPNLNVDDPTVSHFPGISQIISAPFVSLNTASNWKKINKEDVEGTTDIRTRFTRATLAFFMACVNLLSYAYEGARYLQINLPFKETTLNVFSYLVPELGILVCGLEAIYESYSLRRQKKFAQELETKNSPLDKLLYLYSFLHLSPEEQKLITQRVAAHFPHLQKVEQQKTIKLISQNQLNGKVSKLARRLRPWLTEYLAEKIPTTLKNIYSSDSKIAAQGRATAGKIVEIVKIQIQKRQLIHILGLIAATLAIIGFGVSLMVAPHLTVVFVVLTIAGLISTGRFYLAAGLLESKRWRFSVENCIPQGIRWVYRTLKGLWVPPPSPHIWKKPTRSIQMLTMKAAAR